LEQNEFWINLHHEKSAINIDVKEAFVFLGCYFHGWAQVKKGGTIYEDVNVPKLLNHFIDGGINRRL
jgi:hypothetical protein